MGHLLVRASTPGSLRPPRNSREAPPPVEMCEILSGNAGLMDGGDGVAAANDGGGAAAGGCGHGFGHFQRAFRERGHFEDAHRAVPDDGLRVAAIFWR